MGGWDSGPKKIHQRCESMKVLDLKDLRRYFLFPGIPKEYKFPSPSDSSIMISYHGGDSIELFNIDEPFRKRERIQLSWTACGLGGERAWFICPACGRQVRVLYAGNNFKCRICYNLAYSSQLRSKGTRAVKKWKRLKNRFGFSLDPFSLPPRPRGMWWSTYEKKLEAIGDAWSKMNTSLKQEYFPQKKSPEGKHRLKHPQP